MGRDLRSTTCAASAGDRPGGDLAKVGIILVIALLVPGLAWAGWLDPNWAYRQEVTILSTLADADLSDFPYLVKITDPAHPVFAFALPSGDDIVFTDSDGTTQLDHEIETYDSTTKELFAWVRVPLISSTLGTGFFMYYGNGSATNQENADGVWDDDFVLVQHLEETSGTAFDSSGNGNHGTPVGGVNQNVSGKIDGAALLDSVDDLFQIPDDPSLRVVPMTVEAWVYIPNPIPSGFRAIAQHANGTSDWYGLWKSSNGNVFHYRWSTGAVRRTDFATTIVPDRWYHVAGVLDPVGDNAYAYLDGDVDVTVPGPSLPSPAAGSTYIGAALSPPAEFFKGFIDEVRISRIPRSREWLKATFRNLDAPEVFRSLGPEEGPLALVKRAFQLDGTPIASGSTLPLGMPLRFMIYINNPGNSVTDVSFRDSLDTAFGYVAGSMRHDASLASCPASGCSAVDEAALFAAADAGTVATDDPDGDPLSVAGVTLDAGDQNVANTRLDLPPGKVWVLMFTVVMQ